MSDATSGETRQRGLRQIVTYSLLSGLCPLIPIPLLDDWARDILRQRLVALLAASAGVALGGEQTKWLACGHDPAADGCRSGCLKALILRPILFLAHLVFRKVMRKVLFFLTLKDTVDTFSETFHEAYLLRHAFRLGIFPAGPPPEGVKPTAPDPRLLAVREAVVGVYRSADTRPVTSLTRTLFKSSWRGLVATARQMTAVLRRARRDGPQQVTERLRSEGEKGLSDLIDELTEDLEHQDNYLEQLSARLEEQLALA